MQLLDLRAPLKTWHAGHGGSVVGQGTPCRVTDPACASRTRRSIGFGSLVGWWGVLKERDGDTCIKSLQEKNEIEFTLILLYLL